MKNRVVVLAWVGLALSMAASLAQTSGSSFSSAVQPIFDRKCAKCHGMKDQKAKLNLSDGNAYAALVNVPSTEVPGMARVKPGDPEASYLWLKLEHRAPKGSGMPKGFFFAGHLNQQDMDTIKAWIAGGAQP